MIGLIAAVDPNGVIGVDGKIPWHYPGDFKRFKRITLGSTIIMGRKTWESIGRKPLPGRRNVVVTTRINVGDLASGKDVVFANGALGVLRAIQGAETADVWLIGGERIYREGLRFADVVDLTFVPDACATPEGAEIARFPVEDLLLKDWGVEAFQHEDEPALKRQVWKRRTS